VVFYLVTPNSLVGRYIFEEHLASVFRIGVWHKELIQLYKLIARKVAMEGDNEIEPSPGRQEG
jgi:hypothetical protein